MDRIEDLKESCERAKEREEIYKIVKESIKQYKKEENLEAKKKIIHDTKLLMNHYNELKAHIKYSVSDLEELMEKEKELDEEEVLNRQYDADLGIDNDSVYIYSIKKSRVRTVIMLAHIDTALVTLRRIQKEKGTYEKYEALHKKYIERKTMEEIAEELNCTTMTVNRWINHMIGDLGVLIFGIDGIKGVK